MNAQLDALTLAATLRKRLVDFALESGYLRRTDLQAAAKRLWSGEPGAGGLIGDLWIESATASELSPHSTGSLTAAGQFPPVLRDHLNRTGAMPHDRLLYTHQAEAVGATQGNAPGGCPAIVVTAGTGAGKTESFLLPLLADLFGQNAPPADRHGVKAILLYPMNALVNDQVERLEKWLKQQNHPTGRVVTFFHFTGETPEDGAAANRDGIEPYVDPSRIRTRKQARGWETAAGNNIPLIGTPGNVPDILVTNYSMLEYMLTRPQDAVFFGDALRTIVVDEAHLYAGTLAAEVSLLLHRVLLRCGKSAGDVLHMATSATLGGNVDDLRGFAANLFKKDVDSVQVIQGVPRLLTFAPEQAPDNPPVPDVFKEWLAREPILSFPTLMTNAVGDAVLSQNADACELLSARLAPLVANSVLRDAQQQAGNTPALMLHYALSTAPVIQQIGAILETEKRLPLSRLSEKIWGDASDAACAATTALLQAGAAARTAPGELPLLPHRLHLLARPSSGLSVCLNPLCVCPDDRRVAGLGALLAAGGDLCAFCKSRVLTLIRCGECGEAILGGFCGADGAHRPLTPGEKLGRAEMRFFALPTDEAPVGTTVLLSPETALIGTGISLALCEECPCCAAKQDKWGELAAAPNVALSITAETALAEGTPISASGRDYLPARGRRLLAFSDSRREAARLGVRLTNQHERQLFRAIVARHLSDPVNEKRAQSLRDTIGAMSAARSALPPDQKPLLTAQVEALQAQLDTLATPTITAFADRIREDEWGEFFAPETAEKWMRDHEANEWNRDGWRENSAAVQTQTLQFFGREFVSPAASQNSLISSALAEVVYPGLDTAAFDFPAPLQTQLYLDVPDAPPAALSALRGCWRDFVRTILDTLREDGAITIGSFDDNQAMGLAVPVGFWAMESPSLDNRVRFIGATAKQKRRRFAAAVLVRCGFFAAPDDAEAAALSLLRGAWACLTGLDTPPKWLQQQPQNAGDGVSAPALRLFLPELALGSPQTVFRSERVGLLFPRSVAGLSSEARCDDLLPVSQTELENDARYGRLRREYTDDATFCTGLWASEHSAQVSSADNRRLQDLFKRGVRNVLSATTTLELGIDIGGLNTVLLGNVPPGKANYLQRAGRAGRRADGSSVVITFARPRSYDRAVFHDFGNFLDKPLRRPVVQRDRERLAQRHAQAFLLGEFFRRENEKRGVAAAGAMQAFGKIGAFCGYANPPYWEHNAPKPVYAGAADDAYNNAFRQFLLRLREHGDAVLMPQVTELLRGTPLETVLQKRDSFFQNIIDKYDRAVMHWTGKLEDLRGEWNNVADNERRLGLAIFYQIRELWQTTVIEALADRQFLPRYGFPIGMQSLQVLDIERLENGRMRVRPDAGYRLERDGLTAVGEYVPGSRIMVSGKIVRSRGLAKSYAAGQAPEDGFGKGGRMSVCLNNHRYYSVGVDADGCPVCPAPARGETKTLLIPAHGYLTAAWDTPTRRGDPDTVGYAESLTLAFQAGAATGERRESTDFAGVAGLEAIYQSDGEILVFNEGENNGFAICTRCGYSDVEEMRKERANYNGANNLPKGFQSHAPLTNSDPDTFCWRGDGDAPVLRQRVLAARTATDIVQFSMRASEAVATTLSHALAQGGARLLELDSRELGALIVATAEEPGINGPVVYDNVPGGAGHVAELFTRGREWLEAARDVLFVSESHHAHCLKACLDCVLTYSGQRAQERGLLDRPAAFHFINKLLADYSDNKLEEPTPPTLGEEVNDARTARLARLEAARQRRDQIKAN